MWTYRHKQRPGQNWLGATLGIWLAVVVTLLWWVAPSYPEIVNRFYSNGLYHFISGVGAFFARLWPFSTIELTIVVLVVGLPLWLLAVALRKATLRRLGALWAVGRWLLSLVNTAAWLWVLFAVFWGFNHWRTPLPAQLGLVSQQWTPEIRSQALQAAALTTNQLSQQVETACALSSDVSHDNRLMNRWHQAQGMSERSFNKAVPLALSTLATRLQTGGVYNALTFQPTYSQAQHPILAMVTAQHELAHFAGWAGEADASLAAYAALWSSTEPLDAYGAWLTFWYATGEREGLNSQVLADLACIDQYQSVFTPLTISQQLWNSYDGYLKASGGEGIRDYQAGERWALSYFWYKVPRN